MKNLKKICILLCLSFVFLVSCGKNNNANNNPIGDKTPTDNPTKQSENYTIKDYYPFKENVSLKYKGTGNEYAEKTVYTDFINGDKIQLRIINAGTTSAQVLQYTNGELRSLASEGEFYYRDNLTNNEYSKYEVLLKEPLQKGTSWTLSDGKKRYISAVDKEIETPSGNYKALEVTTESGDSTTYDYYALNQGLVKSIFKSNGMEVTTSLEKITKDAPVVQTTKFYYPDDVNDRMVFSKKALNFKTNDDTKEVFEKYFKESPNKNLNPLIGEKVKINKLYLNQKSNTVMVDFTENLVTEMNAGSGLELAILKGITNTLGDYYNTPNVIITMNGKPYSSGHIVLEKGEVLKTDYKNIIEYK
ncbi:GerMN domain-containing protein [Clostridium peptidivorans]|uniref:GerMN domain-containing protein n=1 Tax=Clostridium peptidivorans TaxID=100174 RepID=UPI001FA89880|nr:GerMN domain-containing protein [Clostridium peptidivorans]